MGQDAGGCNDGPNDQKTRVIGCDRVHKLGKWGRCPLVTSQVHMC